VRNKAKVNSLVVISILFIVLSGQAYGDWPSWLGNVIINPENPISTDIVEITLSGGWGTACPPNASAISVVGNDIYFDVIWDYPPGTWCPMIPTGWVRTESVGTLAPGTYNLYTRLVIPYPPSSYTLVEQFVVNFEILVDDFESYADSTALRSVWSDDYIGGSSNAALSTTQAHGGAQSMEVSYDLYNTGYGEVDAPMSYRSDAYSISVYVKGDAGNTIAHPIYVGVYDGSTTAVQQVADVNTMVTDWTECRVSLAALGVTLENIEKVVVGVGDRAGSSLNEYGDIYVDDVSLYPRRCFAANVIAEDFSGNCIVDYDDLDLLSAGYLIAKTAQAPPAAPLSLYLPLDEGEGNTVAHDASGRGLDMEAISITWKPGEGVDGSGAAYSESAGSRLLADDDWDTGGTSDVAKQIFAPAAAVNKFTIMWYFKYDEVDPVVRSFFFQTQLFNPITELRMDNVVTARNRSGAGGYAFWWGRIIHEDGSSDTTEIPIIPFHVDGLSGSNGVDPSICGIWYHLAMVKDGPAQLARVYEDGNLIIELDHESVSYPIDHICSLGIIGAANGAWSASRYTWFDEFRIYPDALTEDEIKYLIGKSDPFFPEGAEVYDLHPDADNIINLKDYSEFSDNWMDDTLWP